MTYVASVGVVLRLPDDSQQVKGYTRKEIDGRKFLVNEAEDLIVDVTFPDKRTMPIIVRKNAKISYLIRVCECIYEKGSLQLQLAVDSRPGDMTVEEMVEEYHNRDSFALELSSRTVDEPISMNIRQNDNISDAVEVRDGNMRAKDLNYNGSLLFEGFCLAEEQKLRSLDVSAGSFEVVVTRRSQIANQVHDEADAAVFAFFTYANEYLRKSTPQIPQEPPRPSVTKVDEAQIMVLVGVLIAKAKKEGLMGH